MNVTQLNDLWRRVLARIKEELNDQRIFDSFIADSYADRLEDNTLYVVANSGLAVQILGAKYASMFEEAVQAAAGTTYLIKFITADDVDNSKPRQEVEKPLFFADARINPAYTFQTFVAGLSNHQAREGSLVVSRDPGKTFNPLFIYGDSGLGKTHLLHAIANAIKATRPMCKVLLITATDFVDEFMKFLTGDQKGSGLKEYFKSSVDVFLIDDIQMLTGKEATMNMFFDVFSSLANAGKQIVITSDKHPSQLNGFEPRLKTRFVQGLTLCVKKPDPETCKEILRKKISANGLDASNFDDEVIEFCADRFSDNVRELEEALNLLVFYTVNIKPTTHVDIEIAMEAVSSLTDMQADSVKLSERKIINTVADYYAIPVNQITGSSRIAQIAMARHICMYLIRYTLDTPLTKIGKSFGGRDHTTVMNSIQKVETELKTNEQMRQAIAELKKKINS